MPRDELRTLQFARARIVWGTHEGTTIPILAATRINGQYFAFVAEKSGASTVAQQRLLHLGELIGNSYAVLDGIKPGDHVIVEGTQFLVDGVAGVRIARGCFSQELRHPDFLRTSSEIEIANINGNRIHARD